MTNNPLACDMQTGICGDANEEIEKITFQATQEKVTLYYVTDPICSHCWALEPVMRKFITQYHQHLNVRTVMGGLLECWNDTPVDPANGISQPQDVAVHWREVGEQTRMPIDGSLWYNHPILSSYPPSKVYRIIADTVSETQALSYLRLLREQLFAFNQNIAEKETLITLVNAIGLDGTTIVQQAYSSEGEQKLHDDFALTRQLGARGFPTIVLVNAKQEGIKIVGARDFATYEQALQQLLPQMTSAKIPPLAELLQQHLLFAKEIEVLYDMTKEEAYQLASSITTAKITPLLGEWYVQLT